METSHRTRGYEIRASQQLMVYFCDVVVQALDMGYTNHIRRNQNIPDEGGLPGSIYKALRDIPHMIFTAVYTDTLVDSSPEQAMAIAEDAYRRALQYASRRLPWDVLQIVRFDKAGKLFEGAPLSQ